MDGQRGGRDNLSVPGRFVLHCKSGRDVSGEIGTVVVLFSLAGVALVADFVLGAVEKSKKRR